MAGIRKIGELSNKLLLKNNSTFYNIRTYKGKTYKAPTLTLTEDELIKPPELMPWMPGRYPVTEEEKREAAKKYNMHPDEYRPQPSREEGVGDYPDLPLICADAKDPYYPWDYPALKRNFNEPIHRIDNLIGEDRYAIGVREQVDGKKGALFGILFITSLVVLAFCLPYVGPPVLEKQYPRNGVYYTFEPKR